MTIKINHREYEVIEQHDMTQYPGLLDSERFKNISTIRGKRGATFLLFERHNSTMFMQNARNGKASEVYQVIVAKAEEGSS